MAHNLLGQHLPGPLSDHDDNAPQAPGIAGGNPGAPGLPGGPLNIELGGAIVGEQVAPVPAVFRLGRSFLSGLDSPVGDFGSGKEGVMSRAAAAAIEERVLTQLKNADGDAPGDFDPAMRNGVLAALYTFLSMHSSADAVDGSGGSLDDDVEFKCSSPNGLLVKMSGADIKRIAAGQNLNRFLACRADDVSVALQTIMARSRLPEGPVQFPFSCETAVFLQKIAVARGIPTLPHLIFPGAKYVTGLSVRTLEALAASAATAIARANVSRRAA